MAFNKNLTLVLLKTSEGKFLFKPFGYHKFLLAVFGFFLNGSSGLLIGFIIGCFFDGQFVPKLQQPKAVDQRLNFLMLAAFIIQTIGRIIASANSGGSDLRSRACGSQTGR